jgi:hypothetical protein
VVLKEVMGSQEESSGVKRSQEELHMFTLKFAHMFAHMLHSCECMFTLMFIHMFEHIITLILGEFTMVSQPIRLILVDWFIFHFFLGRLPFYLFLRSSPILFF